MKTQISRLIFSGMVAFTFIAGGCGGSGMGTSDVSRSSFEGQWTGTYDTPSAGTNGTLTLTIDAGGRIAGNIHDNVANKDATMSGTIARNGGMSVEAQFPGQQTCSLNGLMMLNQTGHTGGCHELGHMVGSNVTYHMGSGNHEIAIHLTPR